MGEHAAEMSGRPRFFRPYERAIVLVAALIISAFVGSFFDTSVGTERLQWWDFVFVVVSNGITGLASALTPLWRVLVGLLVVSPLDLTPDVLLGRPDAWNPKNLAIELIASPLLTWILPYLDPPAPIQRWIANARSGPAAILRKSSVYVAYGVWLLVVFMATILVAESISTLAGYDDGSRDEQIQLARLGIAGITAVATVLLLSVWLFARFLLRGKTEKAFLDPPAFVQRWVTNARSRLTATLIMGCVYIGYVICLSVVFAAIISILAVAREIITILAGLKPGAEDLTEWGLGLFAVLCVIALGVLLVLARNKSRVELRRRFWRSFIWTIVLEVGLAVPAVALTILVSRGVINEPHIWGTNIADELTLLAQSPLLFALDHLAAFLVGGIVRMPMVYGVIWLEDDARTKYRHSVAASIIIALTLMIIMTAWFVLLAGGFGFLMAGADGRHIGVKAGGAVGAAIGIGLTWWLVVRRWPTPMADRPLAEPEREFTSMPDFVADAVRDSADNPI